MGVGYNPKIVTNGLLQHLDAANPKSYPGSGTVWYDLSNNGRNATIVGTPTFAGNHFTSINDTNYFSAASYSHRSDNFTYSMWVTMDPDGYSTLFENGSWGDTLLCRHQSNTIAIYSESVLYGSFPFVPTAGTWYNIVFKRESSLAYGYINGAQSGSSFSLSVDINLANPNLFLMRSQHAANQNNNGKIATFNMYNRSLSDFEIKQNFFALKGRFGL